MTGCIHLGYLENCYALLTCQYKAYDSGYDAQTGEVLIGFRSHIYHTLPAGIVPEHP